MPKRSTPELILRLGSHAEKEYLEKTVQFLDAVMIGANLVEATPGATASLVVRFSSGNRGAIPVIIDPMTYAFGTYRDHLGEPRADLDWIKSDQKIRGQKGKSERKLKKSYRALADQLGGIFERAADNGEAIEPEDLTLATCREVARSVLQYQRERMLAEFAKDEEFSDFAELIPKPRFALAPYFYLDPTNFSAWLDVTFRLIKATVGESNDLPVHAVICADVGALQDAAFMRRLTQELPESGVTGVWFWFSKFDERTATTGHLSAFRRLVESLAPKLAVYNLHGGFFSLALAFRGLTGVSHGIGYGEQKDVLPIIGQSTPTVRYYFPPLRRRSGIPNILVALAKKGVKSAEDFFEQVCDCVVCKGVLGGDLAQLSQFGDQHYSTPQSKRLAQTPAAAKRCRYHFILRRIAEREWVRKSDLPTILAALSGGAQEWGGLRTLTDDAEHLPRWVEALR
jgi:hypothetical protein